jgi:hypothetical protein
MRSWLSIWGTKDTRCSVMVERSKATIPLARALGEYSLLLPWSEATHGSTL